MKIGRSLLHRRYVATWLAIVVLVLSLAPSFSSAPARAKEAQIALYAAGLDGDPDGSTLTALDQETLADRPGWPAIDLGDSVPGWASFLSADGSTMAITVEYGGEVLILNGLGGPVRLTIPTGGESWTIGMSADGSRLVVAMVAYYTDPTPTGPLWKVFDTTSGDLLAEVEGEEGSGPYEKVVVDDAATRLYRLAVPGQDQDVAKNTGPRPARLIVNDLTSGAEIGRLDLPEVMTGSWQSDTVFEGGATAMAQLDPGLAISADGRRLAIAHADEEMVTVVDTQRLAIDRTLAMARPTSWRDRILGLVPLLPQRASAKMMEGKMLSATFAADGRHLYLWGSEGLIDENDQPIMRSLGLRVVDVLTGEVSENALDDAWIGQVLPAPGGPNVHETPSVYVTGTIQDGSATKLWRLDGTNLDLLAERSLPGYLYPTILIRPLPEDQRDAMTGIPPRAGWQWPLLCGDPRRALVWCDGE